MSAPLLTARELADQLGVSTGALLRWTRAGKVPAFKLPSGAVRYRPEAIEVWLAGREMADGADEMRQQPDTPPATRQATLSVCQQPRAEDVGAQDEEE